MGHRNLDNDFIKVNHLSKKTSFERNTSPTISNELFEKDVKHEPMEMHQNDLLINTDNDMESKDGKKIFYN